MNTALARLLAPLSLDEFWTQYWEQSPLHIHRNDRDYFRYLVAPEELEDILTIACRSKSEAVELLGEAAKTETNFNRDSTFSVGAAYDRGASVRILSVQRLHPPLFKLTRDLERTFSFPVRINLYWTPDHQQGLKRHWDTHDVLVVQVAGCKHWRVFEPVVELPLQAPPALPFEETRLLPQSRGAVHSREQMYELVEQAQLREEFVLEQGDILYLPRGVPHEAWTSDQASTHLTIGVHVLTWTDWLTIALGRVANQDVRFRKALPVGFAAETADGDEAQKYVQELLVSLMKKLDVDDAIADAGEELAEIFIRTRSGLGGDLGAGREGLLALCKETVVGHRKGLLCRLIIKLDMVTLYFGNGKFDAPREMEDALRFIAQTESFRIGDIPGGLSLRNQIGVVRRLIEQRFLRILPEKEPYAMS